MQVLGMIVALLFGALMLFNGLIMLISPRRWFEIPPYVAFRGTVPRSSLSTIEGRLRIRVLGLVLTLFILWMAFGVISRTAGLAADGAISPLRFRSVEGLLLLATCLGISTVGALMTFRPMWWLRKYWSQIAPESNLLMPLAKAIRFAGIVFLAGGCYFGWMWLKMR